MLIRDSTTSLRESRHQASQPRQICDAKLEPPLRVLAPRLSPCSTWRPMTGRSQMR